MTAEFRTRFAEQLRQLRDEYQLSANEAAEALALSEADYVRLEADPNLAAEALAQNFMQIDQPNRGQLFRDFVAKLRQDQQG